MEFTGLLLWVQENKASEKFYKKLGFQIIKSDDEHTIIRLSDLEVTLVNMRDEEPFTRDSMTAEKGRGMYIYIKVDDTDAKHKELLEKGLTPRAQPRNWPWGNREFILKDLDGYKLCFWQPI